MTIVMEGMGAVHSCVVVLLLIHCLMLLPKECEYQFSEMGLLDSSFGVHFPVF